MKKQTILIEKLHLPDDDQEVIEIHLSNLTLQRTISRLIYYINKVSTPSPKHVDLRSNSQKLNRVDRSPQRTHDLRYVPRSCGIVFPALIDMGVSFHRNSEDFSSIKRGIVTSLMLP